MVLLCPQRGIQHLIPAICLFIYLVMIAMKQHPFLGHPTCEEPCNYRGKVPRYLVEIVVDPVTLACRVWISLSPPSTIYNGAFPRDRPMLNETLSHRFHLRLFSFGHWSKLLGPGIYMNETRANMGRALDRFHSATGLFPIAYTGRPKHL